MFRVRRETGGLDFTGHYTPVGNPSMILLLDLEPREIRSGRKLVKDRCFTDYRFRSLPQPVYQIPDFPFQVWQSLFCSR